VLFDNNSAAEPGGAIRNFCSLNGRCTAIITNATFSGNQAKSGGAVSSANGSTPQLRNSILWDNLDIIIGVTLSETVHNEGSLSKTYLVNSLVQGSGGSNKWTSDNSYVDGGGNIDTDPKFITPVDPIKAPTSNGNLRLQRGSPAVNAGNNEYVTVTTDLDGSKRIVDGMVDMGAYEALLNFYLPTILSR
jgi:predicted outer membrane repeat protein